MATLILLIIVGFFSLFKEYKLSWFLVRLLELDNRYWKSLFVLIILTRISLFLYRKVWVIRALIRKFYRWIDAGNQNGYSGPSGSKPTNGNGHRFYSTSATARVQKPGSLTPRSKDHIPATRFQRTLRHLKISISGKLGNFFKVITKKGALVSLRQGKGRNSRPTIANLFNNVGFRMFSACFTDKGKYLSRLKQLYSFLNFIVTKTRNHGDVWVVKYLKVSQLALQKAIAGTPVSSLLELEPTLRLGRTVSGVPKWIPKRDRRLMLINHSSSVIRWYLTIFAVYRVISIPGKLNLDTITGGLTVALEAVNRVASEVSLIVPTSRFDLLLLSVTETPFKIGRKGLPYLPILEAASSTSKVSWVGLFKDVRVLKEKNLEDILFKFLAMTGQVHYLKMLTHMSSLLDSVKPMLDIFSKPGDYVPPAGRLALKEEAAGKVRVFAMVTTWDQIALKPLHDMLFAFLKTVPNDATFDQDSSVRRCLEKSTLTGCSFGYDLSAATDRLPLSIQEQILDKIIPGIGKV